MAKTVETIRSKSGAYRCFHCDQTFSGAAARRHFGRPSEGLVPACCEVTDLDLLRNLARFFNTQLRDEAGNDCVAVWWAGRDLLAGTLREVRRRCGLDPNTGEEKSDG